MKNTPFSGFARFLKLRNSILVLSILAISALFISQMTGCSSGPTSPGTTPGMQTTTIYGRVVDESGAAVPGASVAAGTMTAVSDSRGLFIIKNATVPQGRAVVVGKKAGYFNAARASATASNGVTHIDLSMMTDGTTGSVSATSGGTVNIPSTGASIAFPAGSFTDASGAAYTGTVSVAARYLDPKVETFFDYFAGDDIAKTASGKTASLTSAGVLRVELRGASGESLKLDASKPATLTFPKPIDPKAPIVMPLWYFDESLGMWKEEGKATLANGIYTGTVSHFTDWNLDYYDSTTGEMGVYGDVNLRVVCNGAPVSDVVITIVGDDVPGGKYFVHAGGKTGPDGKLHFIRFPANRTTQVDIRSTRNGGKYYINTPITVNLTQGQTLDLGDISLDSPCPATIEGSLTACDDTKAEGLAVVSDGTNIQYSYTKTGDFALSVPSGVILTVDAMDVNGNQATTVAIPALNQSELRNMGSIKICGSATANYIDITSNSAKEGLQLAYSHDGSRLVAWQSQSPQFTIYDTKTGNVISTTPLTGIYYIRNMYFSDDNNKLLLSTTYGPTQLYDVSGATTTMLLSIQNILNARLYDDGTKIVAAASTGYPNPPSLNIYSATDGSILKTLHPLNFGNSGDSTGSFGFNQSEESIVYPDGNTAQTARVWSLKTDAELRNFSYSGQPYTFTTSDDGLTMTATVDYMTYSCYNTLTGIKTGDVKIPVSKSGRLGFPFITQNYLYTTDQSNGVDIMMIFKISDGSSTLKLLSSNAYISSIAASRNEQYLAASPSGLIRIWKLR